MLKQENKKRKRLLIFSAFLLFSFIMWLLIKLSDDYVVTYSTPIVFNEVPAEIWLMEGQYQHNVQTIVSTSGFRHLKASYEIRRSSKGIPISLNRLVWSKQNEHNFFISTSQLIPSLTEKLKLNENEIQFTEKEIVFKAEPTLAKKLPIRFISEVPIKSGYDIYGTISTTPDSMTVFAPKVIADTLTMLPAQADLPNDIQKTIHGTAYIVYNEHLLKPQSTQVEFTIPIEQFTEKRFRLPIQQPKNNALKLFPDHAEAIFRLCIHDFENFHEDAIQIMADTQGLHANRQFLQIDATFSSKKAELIQLIPDKVEYLILKE